MQQGHLVALMLIVEKHFGQVFVVASSVTSSFLKAISLSLLIAFIIMKTDTTINIKLINVFMKTP